MCIGSISVQCVNLNMAWEYFIMVYRLEYGFVVFQYGIHLGIWFLNIPVKYADLDMAREYFINLYRLEYGFVVFQ